MTGAGALLGQGILRCIQPFREEYYIVSVDPDFRSSGFFLSDKAYTVPMANDPLYLSAIEKVITEERIELILIGTDVELPLFSKERGGLEKKYGVKTITSGEDVIRIANDKWATAKFLKDNGFPYPFSVNAIDMEGMTKLRDRGVYPLFAKPRDGARSKGIRTIQSEGDLMDVMKFPGNLVIQEFLEESEGEYTAGCLVLDGKCCAVVVLRRDLRDGNTWRAYSDTSGRFDVFLKSVAEKLGVEGPCNFQFRVRNQEPVIFEINARFSGTTPLRMMFGFNEVKAVLDYYFMGQSRFEVTIKEGTVLRTFSDLWVSNGSLEELKKEGHLEQPQAVEYPFLMQEKIIDRSK